VGVAYRASADTGAQRGMPALYFETRQLLQCLGAKVRGNLVLDQLPIALRRPRSYTLAPILGLTVVCGVSKSDEPDSMQLDATFRALVKMGAIAIEERKDDHREIRRYVVAGPSTGADRTDAESIFHADQGVTE
jgi:hypothetical protein